MKENNIKESAKVAEGKEMKAQYEIMELNGALMNIMIVHKEIDSALRDKVFGVKLRAGRITKELNAAREEIKETTKATDLNAWNAAFMEKWETELKREIEFPVEQLSQSEFNTLMNANKEQGLTSGHMELLYNVFKII